MIIKFNTKNLTKKSTLHNLYKTEKTANNFLAVFYFLLLNTNLTKSHAITFNLYHGLKTFEQQFITP